MKYEKDIILYIDDKIVVEIIQCVKKATPNEACGLIFGKIEERKIPNRENEFSYHYNAYKFECIESSHKNPVAFLMDDYERIFNISYSYAKNYNYQMFSIFHSHPGSAYPSGIDLPYIEGYYNSERTTFKHIIWTIMNAKSKELNGFIFINKELYKVAVKVGEK
ncbi:MAG: Mov34/MPN/PAD-1 family protein [Promethearchaeota archaeon]